MLARSAITGLVLAGGRGTRMGGLDKGLQPFRSIPLARHAALRLSPQVGCVAINANRHVDTYAAWGWPVWSDVEPIGFHGPLAGMLAGLTRASTDWVVTVPCDAPAFPDELVARLTSATRLEETRAAYAACAATGAHRGPEIRSQPTFCIMHRSLADALRAHIEAGGRKVMDWLVQSRAAEVRFEDGAAFFNANTLADLARGEGDEPSPRPGS